MKDLKYIDRSIDYFEMKYCDTDNLTIENYLALRHFQLVRFLKTVFMQAVKYNADTTVINNFVDLLCDYDFIDYDELMILRAFQNTLSKEKTNA